MSRLIRRDGKMKKARLGGSGVDTLMRRQQQDVQGEALAEEKRRASGETNKARRWQDKQGTLEAMQTR